MMIIKRMKKGMAKWPPIKAKNLHKWIKEKKM